MSRVVHLPPTRDFFYARDLSQVINSPPPEVFQPPFRRAATPDEALTSPLAQNLQMYLHELSGWFVTSVAGCRLHRLTSETSKPPVAGHLEALSETNI